MQQRLLAALGLTDDDERVYRALLVWPGATLKELTSQCGRGRRSVETALGVLEDHGFVTTMPGAAATRYLPIDPEAAIEALVAVRRGELERTRAVGVELGKEYRPDVAEPPHVERFIEVVQGRRACTRQYFQLQRSAREEMLIFDRPPYISVEGECADTERDTSSRGVRKRVVYERAALEEPDKVGTLLRGYGAAEESRVVPKLPMKLFIADRRLGLVLLGFDPDEPLELIVRPSLLLDGLVALFEAVWTTAVPMELGGVAAGPNAPDVSAEQHQLLVLLAAGLKDEAISRHVGVGVRTVRRRISDMTNALGAATRFQAGIQVARRGWV